MKPTDLQIGDYVKYQGQIYIIEEISAKGWVHLIHPETRVRVNMTSDYIIDLLEPILLTLEILEENGFMLAKDEPPYKVWMFTDGIITISFEPEVLAFEVRNSGEGSEPDRTMNYFTNYDVVFVHELQHALRLCGINELANNLKLEECA